MSEISERYFAIATGFTARVEGCPPDKWLAPSPCEGWTARDIVSHVVTVHRRVLAGLDVTEASAPAPSEDLVAAWHDATTAMKAALADSSKTAQVIGGRFGAMQFEQLVGGPVSADTLIHTWDLARATGQDERLNPKAVDAATSFLEGVDHQMRVPGGFGPKIESPPDADAQTKLLRLAGREG